MEILVHCKNNVFKTFSNKASSWSLNSCLKLELAASVLWWQAVDLMRPIIIILDLFRVIGQSICRPVCEITIEPS